MRIMLTTRRWIFAVPLATAVGLFSTGQQVLAYSGQELSKQAKISLAAARTTALKIRAGKVTKQELEREPGGSGLRYSFVIKTGSKAYEVGIDARTGEVLENIVEGRNAD